MFFVLILLFIPVVNVPSMADCYCFRKGGTVIQFEMCLLFTFVDNSDGVIVLKFLLTFIEDVPLMADRVCVRKKGKERNYLQKC